MKYSPVQTSCVLSIWHVCTLPIVPFELMRGSSVIALLLVYIVRADDVFCGTAN